MAGPLDVPSFPPSPRNATRDATRDARHATASCLPPQPRAGLGLTPLLLAELSRQRRLQVKRPHLVDWYAAWPLELFTHNSLPFEFGGLAKSRHSGVDASDA